MHKRLWLVALGIVLLGGGEMECTPGKYTVEIEVSNSKETDQTVSVKVGATTMSFTAEPSESTIESLEFEDSDSAADITITAMGMDFLFEGVTDREPEFLVILHPDQATEVLYIDEE